MIPLHTSGKCFYLSLSESCNHTATNVAKIDEVGKYRDTDFDRPLPAEIDQLWPVSKNKVTFEQFFT